MGTEFGIKDIISEGQSENEKNAESNAREIISNYGSFQEHISNAARSGQSETSFYIDELIGSEPSNETWEVIIRYMKELLADEGVKITSYGWEHDDENDEEDYMIYLEW